MPTATRGKFVTCQPHARRVTSISTAPSSSSSMPPLSTMTTQPQAIHPSLSASSSNPMDLSNLTAAIVDTPPPQPHRSPTVPTSTFIHTTSNSKLMSASRGKRKHSALGDDADLSRKHSCPPSATAKAHQEGSVALTTIAQVFPQFLNSFYTPPSINQQDECPPPTSLGSVITLLCTTQGLVDDDVLVLTDFMTANLNEAIAFLTLSGPLLRTSWVQRTLAALCGNAH
jgi:hypothetical protein